MPSLQAMLQSEVNYSRHYLIYRKLSKIYFIAYCWRILVTAMTTTMYVFVVDAYMEVVMLIGLIIIGFWYDAHA